MSCWFDIRVKKVHHKVKCLLDVSYTSERELLALWISEFQIKDGVDKTIKQFQETFHSIFWEVYLNKIFLESKFEIVKGIVSPDFLLLDGNKKIFVEAVVSNIAEAEPKESDRTIDDIYGENDYYEILDESIIRLYNTFCNKQERFKNHYSKNNDILSSPFLLAIGDYGQINYGQSYYYPMLALLYGAYYDKDEKREDLKILCEDSFNKEYKFISTHMKKNGAILKVGLFNSEEYKNISAVIYSCNTTLGKLSSLVENHIPFDKCIVVDREVANFESRILRYSNQQPDETLYDGIIIYHNPYATNKLSNDFMNENGVVHIRYDEEAEQAINIAFSHRGGILKRRQVCHKGFEQDFIDGFKNLTFLPVIRM